ESLSQFTDVFNGHRLGHLKLPLAAIHRELLAFGTNSRGTPRCGGMGVTLRLTASVHQLSEEFCARGMDSVDAYAQTLGMRGVGNAWLEVIALAGVVVDVQAFGDQQAKTPIGEIAVVAGHSVGGQTLGGGTYPGHRCQRDTVGQRHTTDRYWGKEG